MGQLARKRSGLTFDQLSDHAKERARDWWRENDDDRDFDFVLEDARTCLAFLGFSIEHDGVAFSGFCGQGDGASFVGTWTGRDVSPTRLHEHAQDAELTRMVTALRGIADRYPDCGAKVTSNGYREVWWGNRIGKAVTRMDVIRGTAQAFAEPGDDPPDEFEDAETADDFTELCRDAARWIYRQLDAENDDRNSDECVDETLTANDYRFDDTGEWLD